MHIGTSKQSNTYNRTHLTDRGYTGHGLSRNFSEKHLPCFNFISIACPEPGSGNGRVYDPQVGAFLSPDPFVQAPFNTQSYNRYAYVFNNPMKYVDPSGYKGLPFTMEDPTNMPDHRDFNYPSMWFGGGGSGFFNESPYQFNWITRRYENSAGEEVLYWEVHNNYIIPNASEYYNYSTGEGFIENMSIRFGYNYLPEKPTEGYEWIRVVGNRSAASSGGRYRENSSFKNDPWWYFPTDAFTYLAIAIDIIAKLENVPGGKAPGLGNFAFGLQTLKSYSQLKDYYNGDTSINPDKAFQDFFASGVGTFFGTGGFIGAAHYLLIDKTVGMENYVNSFNHAVQSYSRTGDPSYLRAWKR